MADLIQSYYDAAQKAYANQLKRSKEVQSIYDRIIGMYGEGSTYGKAAEYQLELRKTRDVGATIQRDISRGLYGIRPYEAEWEQTVGTPERLTLEDIKSQRLASALAMKAGSLQDITEQYPDYSALQQALAAQASVPTTYGGGYEPLPSGSGMMTAPAVTPSTTTPSGGPYGISTAEPIQMGQGYGPAFEGGAEKGEYTGGGGRPDTQEGAGTIPEKYKDYYGKEITDPITRQAIDAVGITTRLSGAGLQKIMAVDKMAKKLRSGGTTAPVTYGGFQMLGG